MLWIAFKSLYLWYSKQLIIYVFRKSLCCELLSKVYIFDIRNNPLHHNIKPKTVVNCFQKFISLIFETTCIYGSRFGRALWIAFKSLYLWYSKQHGFMVVVIEIGCELLSKVYIFDIRNNKFSQSVKYLQVVNCFQKFISLIFETTESQRSRCRYWLWIAFKSLYLWYSKQHTFCQLIAKMCCELLSKVYIFDIRNNFYPAILLQRNVVNCFQKFISLIFETTLLPLLTINTPLWIAFKSLYLWYSKQLSNSLMTMAMCCELLSKVYIFDIRNNLQNRILVPRHVVNCFQKFISLIFETTPIGKLSSHMRCELLSKVYIFDIRNNRERWKSKHFLVVNCFQKFISLIFETTRLFGRGRCN